MAGTHESLQAELVRLLEPELGLHGFALVDLEVLRGGGRLTLRVTIEKAGADDSRVGVDDCAAASRAVSRVLDAEGDALVQGRYVIEVSSPGIFRRLRKPADFARSVNEIVKVIVTASPDGEATREVRGRLTRVDAGAIEIESEDGVRHSFAYEELRKARLDPDLSIGSRHRPRRARN
jgi:ribosome maturation factor RimP